MQPLHIYQLENSQRAPTKRNSMTAPSTLPNIYSHPTFPPAEQLKMQRRIIQSPFLVTELCTLGLAQGGSTPSLTWHCLSMADLLSHPPELISVVNPSSTSDEPAPFIPYSHLPAQPVSAPADQLTNSFDHKPQSPAHSHIPPSGKPLPSSLLEAPLDSSLQQNTNLISEQPIDSQDVSLPQSQLEPQLDLSPPIIRQSQNESTLIESRKEPLSEPRNNSLADSKTEPVFESQSNASDVVQNEQSVESQTKPLEHSSIEAILEAEPIPLSQIETKVPTQIPMEPESHSDTEIQSTIGTESKPLADSPSKPSTDTQVISVNSESQIRQLDTPVLSDLERRLSIAEAEATFAKNEVQRSDSVIATLRSQLEAATSACEKLLETVKEQEQTIELLS